MSLVLMVCAAWTQSAQAAEKGDKKGGGGVVATILKHADELKVTAEQKTKLEALSKEAPKDGEKKSNPMEKVKEILSPEQMTQLKELMAKDRPKKKTE